MIGCRGLCAGYGRRSVLHSVDFCASGKEFVVLLGPNGSGKTTLLRTLSGVLTRSAGEVTLGGVTLERLKPRERARRVAVVPQRVDYLPQVKVRDMVLLGRYPYLSWLGTYSREDHEVAEAVLHESGAMDLAGRSVRELSGGELQRVLLARALAQGAPVLLLDELSAGLDMARMIELFDVLEKRCRQGCCVVTVMHDVNLAALYATRVVGLKEGRLCFDGPTSQVFTEENLSELYATPIHVFPHPTLPVPQACPGRRAEAQTFAAGSGTVSHSGTVVAAFHSEGCGEHC